MFKSAIKNQKGVSLIEMMIAVYILVTAILAGIYLSMVNFISLNVSEKNFTSVNLAREAIEVIRNKRDENWLSRLLWYQDIMNDPLAYRIKVDFRYSRWFITEAFEDIEDCDLCRLVYRPDNGNVMNHDTRNNPYVDSPYYRLVRLRQICWSDTSRSEIILSEGDACESDPEFTWIGLDVKAQVFWKSGPRTGLVTLEDRLYDWR